MVKNKKGGDNIYHNVAKINNRKSAKINKDYTFYLKVINNENSSKIKINNNYLTIANLNAICKDIDDKIEIEKKILPFSISGGASLLSEDINTIVRDEYKEFIDYIYKSDIDNVIKNTLENTIDNLGNGGVIRDIIIKDHNNNDKSLNNLKDFILANNTEIRNNITFNIGYKYKFNNINNVDLETPPSPLVSYSLEYYYKEYNKNIVESFQKKLIDNHANIQDLINLHRDYIENYLTPKYRCTINDYTNPEAYNFYSKYYKSGLPNWLDIYKTNVHVSQQFMFGDAFLPQIIEYYHDNIKETVLGQIRSGVAINPIYLTIHNTIVNFENSNRKNAQEKSWFFNKLDENDWNQILEKFEEDLNNIIINAPIAPSNIYCYRGANKHVIENQTAINDDNISLNCYQTSRITSFSIAYTAAQNFYYSNGDTAFDTVSNEACLYRTTIMQGANVLFIESITSCYGEFEIITPSNTVIVDPIGFNIRLSTSTSLLPRLNQYVIDHQQHIKYNNIDNRAGISGKHYEKIQSIDIIVVGCPPPPPPRPGFP